LAAAGDLFAPLFRPFRLNVLAAGTQGYVGHGEAVASLPWAVTGSALQACAALVAIQFYRRVALVNFSPDSQFSLDS
jgi:hypothetical protein